MTAPLRIALIHTPLSHSTGGERQVLRLAMEWTAMGQQVELFTGFVDRELCFPDWLSRVKITEVPETRPPALLNLADKLQHLELARGVEKLGIMAIGNRLSSGCYDIIHCHNPTSIWAAWLAKERLHLPVAWMCNEPPYWHYQPGARSRFGFPCEHLLYGCFDRLAVRAADEIAVLSEAFARLVRRVYGREAMVVRSGIDSEFFAAGNGSTIRQTRNWREDFVILQVGAAVPAKSSSTTIRAFAQLHRQYPAMRLVFVGHGTETMYGPEITACGLRGRTEYLSYVDDRMLRDLYTAADVLVFPFAQSWGLAAVEAMAAGTSVIVSAAAGVAEVVQDGVTGLVTPHDDAAANAARLKELADNPALRRRLGMAGRNYVRASLSWRKYAEAMLRVLQRAQARKRQS